MKFGDTLFGNSRSWKRSQGQVPKNYFLNFFDGEFRMLGKFPLRIWFVTHMRLVDFELQAFLLWRFSPKYTDLTFFQGQYLGKYFTK